MLKFESKLESSDKNIWKYIFTVDNKGTIEAVLYRYETFNKRTVICCSVSSGCGVGCTFCGTGNKFVCHLESDDIVNQIRYIIMDNGIITDNCKKFQIMFMSMGEPFHNFSQVKQSIVDLHKLYPNAELLVSTMAPSTLLVHWKDFISLCTSIDKVGLQFSIHASNDQKRNELIPYVKKLDLANIKKYGELWAGATNRRPYLNFCVDEKFTEEDVEFVHDIYSPAIFNITLSVICSPDESMRDAGYRNIGKIREIEKLFINMGYNTRVFNPDGQDDIGGGCGQLWHFQKKHLDCS
jgi:23S rRNA (adenine2503-C2)-methyltransferase